MCNCQSYNRPESTGSVPEVVLDQARYFPDTGRPRVCVDACIAGMIEALWTAGIRTRACCCGHNGLFGPPSVFLDDPKDAEAAVSVLATDPREWHVVLWAGGIRPKSSA